MEYFTFILLLIGVALVAGGIFLSKSEKNNSTNYSLFKKNPIDNLERNSHAASNNFHENLQRIEAKLEKLGLNNNPSSHSGLNSKESISKNINEEVLINEEKPQRESISNHQNPARMDSFSSQNIDNRHISKEDVISLSENKLHSYATYGHPSLNQNDHFHQSSRPENLENTTPQINQVFVSMQNPKLFMQDCHMYLDSSNSNSYTGHESNFEIRDVVGIKRFGQGRLSYDGYGFSFQHQTGEERFSLNSIDHIAFYPNCVVLASKNSLPSALFFMEETSSLRDVLKTFQLP